MYTWKLFPEMNKTRAIFIVKFLIQNDLPNILVKLFSLFLEHPVYTYMQSVPGFNSQQVPISSMSRNMNKKRTRTHPSNVLRIIFE